MPVLEVRTYELEPGALGTLQSLFQEKVLPLLRASGHDVVHWGGSPHDPDAFVLLRAYPDEPTRSAAQDAFYDSVNWREGPRTDAGPDPHLRLRRAADRGDGPGGVAHGIGQLPTR